MSDVIHLRPVSVLKNADANLLQDLHEGGPIPFDCHTCKHTWKAETARESDGCTTLCDATSSTPANGRVAAMYTSSAMMKFSDAHGDCRLWQPKDEHIARAMKRPVKDPRSSSEPTKVEKLSSADVLTIVALGIGLLGFIAYLILAQVFHS